MPECRLPEWDRDNFKVLGVKEKDFATITTYQLPDIFPVGGTDQPFALDHYLVEPGRPTVIIHPILGGDNPVAEEFAWYFAERAGWNAVIQHRAKRPTDYGTLELIEPGFEKIIVNGCQTFDWLEHHGHIERDRAFCLGTSMGGISTALLAPYLPARGFILVMAGGNLPEILTRSDEKKLVRWRKDTLRQLGIDEAELRARLKAIIRTDPLRLAPEAGGKNIRMFISLFDRTVPTRYQKALRKAYPVKPETSWVPSGHLTLVFFLRWVERQCVKWIRRQL